MDGSKISEAVRSVVPQQIAKELQRVHSDERVREARLCCDVHTYDIETCIVVSAAAPPAPQNKSSSNGLGLRKQPPQHVQFLLFAAADDAGAASGGGDTEAPGAAFQSLGVDGHILWR